MASCAGVAHAVTCAPRCAAGRGRGRPRKAASRTALRRAPASLLLLPAAFVVQLQTLPSALATDDSPFGVLDALFTSTVTTAVVSAFAVSAWPLLSPPGAQPRLATTQQLSEAEQEADEQKWAVASVISFLPFTNWFAWAGLAATDEGPARYFAFAVIYALPYLHSGLEFEQLNVFAWLACAVHLQLERVIRTQPPGGGPLSSGGSGGSISDMLSSWAQPPPPMASLPAPRRRRAVPRRGEGDADAARKEPETRDSELNPPPQPPPSSFARALGARLGSLTATLSTLREEFAAGKAGAESAAATERAEAELTAFRSDSRQELDAWDARFGLRAASRPQLLQLARERGLRGASRLTKRELADLLEAHLAVEEEEEQAEAGAAEEGGSVSET